MALQNELLDLTNGFKTDTAYYKIKLIEVQKDKVRIVLDVSMEKGLKSIKEIAFTTPLDVLNLKYNIIEACYNELKKLPLFEKSIDC